jgi:hypothetical protein
MTEVHFCYWMNLKYLSNLWIWHHCHSGMGEIVNIGDLDLGNYHISFCNCDIDNDHYRFFENLTAPGQKSWYRWFDTIWYHLPILPFRDISKLYCLMYKFSICNHLFPNVLYETNIFVVKMVQIQDYVM